MDILAKFIDIFLHLDEYLSVVIQTYGVWTYALLFLVIFMETGFVVTPFLPGDSLLFAAGTFASPALGEPLNIFVVWILMSAAAILGDTVNYWIGHFIGPKAFSGEVKFLKKEYMDRTHEFYEKHGGKTIILARFIPIIRTFAPFVAGVGRMTYSHFLFYNVIGGLTWVTMFVFGGYFFGSLPFVKDNFTIVVLTIIGISLMPGVIEFLRNKFQKQESEAEA